MRKTVTLLSLLIPAALVAQRGAAPAKSEAAASPAAVVAKVDPKEWKTPWPAADRARDPFPDPQGRVWFVGQQGNYIAYLDSKSGEFKRFEIDAGTNPHNLVFHQGMVWFTGNRNGRIVKMDPATGKLTTFVIPAADSVRDPHTMIFDNEGNAWFTAQGAQAIGKLDPKTGKFWIHKFPRNANGHNANPYGIVLNSKGVPFFDLFARNSIGSVDPKTMQVKEYVLPDVATRPRRIAVTSDDMIWYGDYSQRGMLGRLDPRTGEVKEYPMPSGARSQPYAMASDDRDYVWLAETGVAPNRLVAFDTKRGVWAEQIEVGDPGSRNTIRHMVFDKTTREIWFGTDQGTIGRLKIPPVIIHP
jgi:virginiamycin B lyase